MQNSELPTTFCPAKWDEVVTNLHYNYVYACCKAKPMQFVKDFKIALREQQNNLLNGIQDPSCEYCWQIENAGGQSLRLRYLNDFDNTKFSNYQEFNSIKKLEINIGNSCNMQCMYCNPKFSSQWEADLKYKKYPLLTDRFVYELVEKETNITESNLALILEQQVEHLSIIGGEPLYNKVFFQIVDSKKFKHLELTTNLMVKNQTLKKLLDLQNHVEKLTINCSIDATKELAEFVRHGLDYFTFINNLEFLLANVDQSKTSIRISSLATSMTIVGIPDLYEVITALKNNYKINLTWIISYCMNPKVHSFQSLPIDKRLTLINSLSTIDCDDSIIGLSSVIDALKSIEYSKQIHKELTYFLREWCARKNIQIPNLIKETLCLE